MGAGVKKKRRPTPDALRKELKKLRAEVEALKKPQATFAEWKEVYGEGSFDYRLGVEWASPW